MTGMLMTAADGLGMKRVALPWASPELFADAALELENLDSLLLVLSGAARGLFGVLTWALSELIGQRTGIFCLFLLNRTSTQHRRLINKFVDHCTQGPPLRRS